MWGSPQRKARLVRQTQDAVSPSGERKRNAHKQEPEIPYSQIQVSINSFKEYLVDILHKFAYDFKLEKTEKLRSNFRDINLYTFCLGGTGWTSIPTKEDPSIWYTTLICVAFVVWLSSCSSTRLSQSNQCIKSAVFSFGNNNFGKTLIKQLIQKKLNFHKNMASIWETIKRYLIQKVTI